MNRTLARLSACCLLAVLLAVSLLPSIAENAYDSVTLAESAATFNLPGKANRNTTVRQGASDQSTALGTLKKGTIVNVIKCDKTWAYVEYKGKYGYVRHKYLDHVDEPEATATPQPTATPLPVETLKALDEPYTARAAQNVKVYSAASDKADFEGTLKKDREVTVVAVGESWAKVTLSGNTGYCLVKYLTRVETEPEATATPQPTVTPLPVETLKTLDEPYTARAAQNIKVYSAASDKADFEGTLKKDHEVTVVAVGESWAKVTLSGHTGYCLVKYLTRVEDEPEATATPQPTATPLPVETLKTLDDPYTARAAQNIKVYSAASDKADFEGTLKKDHEVTVVAVGENWAKVTLSGHTGYCLVKYLTKIEEETEVSVKSVPKTVTLSSSYVTTMPDSLASETETYKTYMGNGGKIEHMIYVAQNLLGTAYSSCHAVALPVAAFKSVGISLGYTVSSLLNDTRFTTITSVSSLRRGDLVFFDTSGDGEADHVGIYVGGGCFIQSSLSAGSVVLSSLSGGYYNRSFVAGVRVIGE